MSVGNAYIETLINKGYVVIKNDLSLDEVKVMVETCKQVQKQAILETYGVKKFDSQGDAKIFKDDDDKPYVWKTQNILLRTEKGKYYIDKWNKILSNIHPNIRFIKDRYMNQKKNYQGHLPHQDNSAASHQQITNQWFTVYTSLTDTDKESGCIWVEDVEQKRTKSVGMCDDGCASGNICKCMSIKVMPLDIENYKGHKMIPIELKKGDTIIFDGWVLHGTAANLSDNPRQTVMYTYGLVKDEDLHINDIYKHYTDLHRQKYNG